MTEAKFRKVVVFDFDSTLCGIEGIDELAKLKGDAIFRQVEQMTCAAMDGDSSLQSVYQKRLSLIGPLNEEDFLQLTLLYRKNLSNNVEHYFSLLRDRGWLLGILSGGLKQAIEPISKELKIDFFEAVDYDNVEASPLIDTKGKMIVLEEWRKKFRLDQIVMVGDGVSDLQTKTHVDLFIGYGEFVQRKIVQMNCDIFVTNLKQLCKVLENFEAKIHEVENCRSN